MTELIGKYNNAKVFTDNLDSETHAQILNFLDQDFVKDSQIRIMPDCHAGAGCVIGFTADLGDKVVPNLVGGRYWVWSYNSGTGKYRYRFRKTRRNYS